METRNPSRQTQDQENLVTDIGRDLFRDSGGREDCSNTFHFLEPNQESAQPRAAVLPKLKFFLLE